MAKGNNKVGRPSTYTEEVARRILERIENGESLLKITRDPDMPRRSSVHKWLAEKPEFSDRYARSKEIQADVYADEMDDIAQDLSIDVNRARLIIDTRKWTAAKLKPKKYGDKLDVTSGGEKITPLLNAVIPPQN